MSARVHLYVAKPADGGGGGGGWWWLGCLVWRGGRIKVARLGAVQSSALLCIRSSFCGNQFVHSTHACNAKITLLVLIAINVSYLGVSLLNLLSRTAFL